MAQLPAHDDLEVVVSHMRNLRITTALTAMALAMAIVPSAQAATNTCNEARNGHTGVYTAVDGDPATPARHQSNIAVLGSNQGLTRAAANSPALSECVIVVPAPQPQVTAE